MALTAAEQYMIELINRARLDPLAEAQRQGIDLNQGLAANTISTAAKQVLAPNAALEQAAIAHSLWMLSADIISHTGPGGNTPVQRAQAEGYAGSYVGENIAWAGTSAPTIDLAAQIDGQHRGLFLSSGHRTNILRTEYREVGIGQETGIFTSPDSLGVMRDWTSSMITQVYGTVWSQTFLTGAAYTDTNGDRFYSMGEGVAGVSFSIGGASAATASAGGYALLAGTGSAVAVSGSHAGGSFAVTLDFSAGNVKLDLVGGALLMTSGNMTLVSGIASAGLLGVAQLSLTGNGADNTLSGNRAANTLSGLDGDDTIRGGGGGDRIEGGAQYDRLFGDGGSDRMFGGDGRDILRGGAGNDRLSGDRDQDTLWGDDGADAFIFHRGTGADRVMDFSLAEGDRLVLNDSLWLGVVKTAAQVVADHARLSGGEVLFDFGAGGSIRLDGIASTAGLAAAIDII